MRIAAILVAAGSGTRYGAEVPKQFLTIAGKSVIRHAAEALSVHVSLLQPVGDAGPIEAALRARAPEVDPTWDVNRPLKQTELERESVDLTLSRSNGLRVLPVIQGGATRQDSVRAGLEALAPHDPEIVLVHDAARPVIPDGTIPALLAALRESAGAIPGVPVADTLKQVVRGVITATVPRAGLFRAQTPQAFRFQTLLAAHRTGLPGATDDASLLEAAGETVTVVPGSDDNIKLTYPGDLIRLERIMTVEMIPHVGTGFDVHMLEQGRALFLCGVQVPHDKGLAGHSDADVGIHALCDAIYGALAEGDIGRHFPPSEAIWKGADSARFLTHAAERIAARGAELVNADITLICERPKITPHAPAMIKRLASLLGVKSNRVSVKATTTEKLGFTGRGEGIAAQAVVSILVPR